MLASIISLAILMQERVHSWSHDDMQHWVDTWPECGLQSQSPIDLPVNIDVSDCDDPLVLDWTSEIQHFAVRNNGHSLVAIPFHIDTNGFGDVSGLEVLHHTNDTNIRLQNAFYNTFQSRVNKEYCFNSLHFHWAQNNSHGSEHTINGVEYPLELHLVHYSCDWFMIGDALNDYASGTANSKYDDDHVLAVIGIIFEIGDPNPVLQNILDDLIIDGIAQFHDPIEKYGDHLLELYYAEMDMNGLLPVNREMVAYSGSLTTPPCYETVRWHVMKHKMTVSEEQMEQFRSLLSSTNSSDEIAPNYRPVQELHEREIYYCQQDVEDIMVAKDSLTVNFDENESKSSSSENTWFILGVTFIVLFGVSVCIILYLAYIVRVLAKDRRNPFKDDKGAYGRAKHNEVESGQISSNQ